jgi:radical SAM protein with 4Fe4S-binding SPASM domain
VRLQLTTPERTNAEEHHLETVLAQYYSHSEGAAPQTRQCMIPWEVPYIDKDGRVFPCCIAGASSQSQVGRLGDLDHGTLSDIWAGDAYQDFRRALLDADTTPEVCQSCTIVPAGPHPLRAYSAELVGPIRIATGDGEVSVRFRNTGTGTWVPDRVQVATTSPRDRRSEVAHRSWLSATRPCSFVERIVAPAGTATFTFRVMLQPRRSREEFQLIAEGVTWLPNTRFTVVTPTAMRHPGRTAHWLAGRARQALRP